MVFFMFLGIVLSSIYIIILYKANNRNLSHKIFNLKMKSVMLLKIKMLK